METLGGKWALVTGAMVPALLGNGFSSRFFRAQDYAGLQPSEAMEKARRE
jgi:hypothetical protein